MISEAAERSCVFVFDGAMLRSQAQFYLFLFSVPDFAVTRGTRAADGTVRQIVLSHVHGGVLFSVHEPCDVYRFQGSWLQVFLRQVRGRKGREGTG